MRIAIVDPFAGVSGDMLLGALVSAGVQTSWLTSLPARLGFPEVGVEVRTVLRCGVRATKVDFQIPEGQSGIGSHGAHVAQLVELVRRAEVGPVVRQRAVRALELIGAAEGEVHAVAPERVHLHEVGAVDAVLDLVGVIEGFEHLGAAAVYNFPVALGSGWIDAAHGTLPVPAPATELLLQELEVVRERPVLGEATTPTGAALLRVLSSGPPPASWRLVRSGWGAGSRDPDEYPNAVRLLVAEGAEEAGEVDIVATDVDDLQPEYVEPLRDALAAAGALDCWIWPTYGKKGRVALRIEALAPAGSVEAVARAFFAHSTTTGVRHWRAQRATLARREITIALEPEIAIRVKVSNAPGGWRIKPEFQDVLRASERLKRSALSVAHEATRRAEAALEDGAVG